MLLGVVLSAVSQIMLKKSADRERKKWYQQYLNWLVIGAYIIYIAVTLINIAAYRVVPLSMAPVWAAASHIIVTLLSLIFLREKPNRKKLLGLGIITIGILLFL